MSAEGQAEASTERHPPDPLHLIARHMHHFDAYACTDFYTLPVLVHSKNRWLR